MMMTLTMAAPGFPRGGRQPLKDGANLLFYQFSQKPNESEEFFAPRGIVPGASS